MTERKKDTLPDIIDVIIEQITRPNRQGSLSEIRSGRSYVFHVRGNPTKSLPDTIKWLYEEIDNLGGYVTDGVSDEDVKIIQQLFTRLTGKKVIKPNGHNLFTNMLNDIVNRRNNDQILENHGICLVLAPDNDHSYPPFLITDVPKKE